MVVKLRGILTNGEGEIGNHSSFDVGAVDLGDNLSKLSKTVWTEDRSSVHRGRCRLGSSCLPYPVKKTIQIYASWGREKLLSRIHKKTEKYFGLLYQVLLKDNWDRT